jgi:hypothetical protein
MSAEVAALGVTIKDEPRQNDLFEAISDLNRGCVSKKSSGFASDFSSV